MPTVNVNLTIDKTTVGLSNVDNTSDANKPISTATQTALDTKLDAADYVQHFLGVYASLVALEAAHPTADSGDYAQVDPGTGTNLQTYSWDIDEGWVLSSADGSGASNTDQLPEGATNLYYTTTRVNTWWDGIKSAAQTISGLWSFTGGIKSKTVTVDGAGTDGKVYFEHVNGGYIEANNIIYIKGGNPVIDVCAEGGADLRVGTDPNGTAGKGLYHKAWNGTAWKTILRILNVSSGDPLLNVDEKAVFAKAPRFESGTASQVVELDSNKDFTTAAKGTAYNKSFGTTAGTVAQGNDYRFGSQAAISGTDIDWSTATHFYKTLSANTIFTFSNLADAKTIQVAITNTASNYTVTWPTVDWGSAGAPTQRTGAVTDIYTFTRINETVYGAVRQ